MHSESSSPRLRVLQVFLLAEVEELVNKDIYAAMGATTRLEQLALCKVLVRLTDAGFLRMIKSRTRELTIAGYKEAGEHMKEKTITALPTEKQRKIREILTPQDVPDDGSLPWWEDPTQKPARSGNFGWMPTKMAASPAGVGK